MALEIFRPKFIMRSWEILTRGHHGEPTRTGYQMNPRPLWSDDVGPYLLSHCFLKRASLSTPWPTVYQRPAGYWLPVLCQELLFKNTSHVFLCSLMSGHKMEISFYQRWRGCQKTNGCCCGGVLEEGGTGPCGVWIDWVLSIAIRLSEYSATVTAI